MSKITIPHVSYISLIYICNRTVLDESRVCVRPRTMFLMTDESSVESVVVVGDHLLLIFGSPRPVLLSAKKSLGSKAEKDLD